MFVIFLEGQARRVAFTREEMDADERNRSVTVVAVTLRSPRFHELNSEMTRLTRDDVKKFSKQ